MNRIINRKIIFCFGLIAVASLGGCATPDYLSVDQVSEESLARISFPAPTESIDLIRARYIAGAVGLYGVNSIQAYSGSQRTSDAQATLTQLIDIMNIQDAQLVTLVNPPSKYDPQADFNFNVTYRRLATLKLVAAAVNPTVRYYKAHILNFIIDRSAIGAADTAFEALKNLAEVKAYKEAILSDGRVFALSQASQGKSADTTSDATKAKLTDYCNNHVNADLISEYKPEESSATIEWWRYLAPDVGQKLCTKTKPPQVGTDPSLTKTETKERDYALAISDKELDPSKVFAISGDVSKITSDNITTSSSVWNSASQLMYQACKGLRQLAGLSTKTDPPGDTDCSTSK